jgi:glucosylceramidase
MKLDSHILLLTLGKFVIIELPYFPFLNRYLKSIGGAQLMKKRISLLAFMFIMIFLPTIALPITALSDSNGQKSTVNVWMTTIDQKNLLKQQEDIKLSQDKANVKYEFNIIESRKYQQMDGFGASFTDASAWLVYNKLSPEARDNLMKKLFDKNEGIGISMLRQPMGASDFALNVYSYDDMDKGKKDYDLKSFSINHDKAYIIPVLKQALSINKDIKIMASPWSAPGWMKDSNSMITGTLKSDSYSTYANYFVKFIKAYESEGIPIYAITPQNEPYVTPSLYPGMWFDEFENVKFIKKYLGPAFEKNGINAKIICYDHNWDYTQYPETVYGDPGSSKYVAGSAWHWYQGDPDAMSYIHNEFPKKDIWFTEGSGSDGAKPFHDAFMKETKNIIRIPRNWSKSVIWWNVALDENNGPYIPAPKSTCRGMVLINQKDGSVTYNVDYYSMGHVSKFVDSGAYRIYSKSYTDDLESVAFKNPDGTDVFVVSNRTTAAKTFKVNCSGKSFKYTIPGEAAITFKW